MFRAAVLGDIHFSDRSPISRSDNYPVVLLEKVNYVLEYCAKENIQYLFLVGDIFHEKNPQRTSHALVAKVVRMFSGFGGNIIAVAGNHDFAGHSKEAKKYPIEVLSSSGALRLLGGQDESPSVIAGGGRNAVEINGAPYGGEKGPAGADLTGYKLSFEHADSYKIGIFHSMVLPDEQDFFDDYSSFSEVAPHANVDVLLCGHYHAGYPGGIVKAQGKIWINPGAVGRGTTHGYNWTRTPCFVVFSVQDGIFDGRALPIPCRPAQEVLAEPQGTKIKIPTNDRYKIFVQMLKDQLEEQKDTITQDFLLRMAKKFAKSRDVYEKTRDLIFRAEYK